MPERFVLGGVSIADLFSCPGACTASLPPTAQALLFDGHPRGGDSEGDSARFDNPVALCYHAGVCRSVARMGHRGALYQIQPQAKVIALSLHDDAPTGARSERAGAEPFVAKLASPEALLSAIRRVVQQEGSASPASLS